MTVPHALQLERELRLELNHSTVLFNDTQAQHMIEVAIAGNPVTGRRWIAPLAAAVVIAGMLAVSVGFGGGALGPRVSPSAASAPSNSLSPTASTAPVKASLAPHRQFSRRRGHQAAAIDGLDHPAVLPPGGWGAVRASMP